MIAPVRLSPACAQSGHRVVHVGRGAPGGRRVDVSDAGSAMPKSLSRLTKYPDQPTPTVAAPTAYSSTRSQPMIQATSSPIVAYE